MNKELSLDAKLTESETVNSLVKMRNQEARDTGQAESLYVSLAHLFLQEGRRDLVRLDAERQDILRGLANLNQHPRWGYEVASAHAGILFATAVKVIEQTIADKAFDSYYYHTSHDDALAGINFIKKFNAPVSKPTSITDQKWGEMINFSKKDPTFAIFFEKRGGLCCLPEIIRSDIAGAGVFYIIQQDILPRYTALAANITMPNSKFAHYPALEAQKAV